MRYTIVLIITLAANNATAQDGDWLAASTALLAADWMQTREIIIRPDLRENNPGLGAKPTAREVDRYFSAAILLNAAAGLVLEKKNAVRVWKSVTLLQTIVVTHNRVQFGVTGSF